MNELESGVSEREPLILTYFIGEKNELWFLIYSMSERGNLLIPIFSISEKMNLLFGSIPWVEDKNKQKNEPFIFYKELNCAIQVDIDIAIDILTLLQETKTKQCDP